MIVFIVTLVRILFLSLINLTFFIKVDEDNFRFSRCLSFFECLILMDSVNCVEILLSKKLGIGLRHPLKTSSSIEMLSTLMKYNIGKDEQATLHHFINIDEKIEYFPNPDAQLSIINLLLDYGKDINEVAEVEVDDNLHILLPCDFAQEPMILEHLIKRGANIQETLLKHLQNNVDKDNFEEDPILLILLLNGSDDQTIIDKRKSITCKQFILQHNKVGQKYYDLVNSKRQFEKSEELLYYTTLNQEKEETKDEEELLLLCSLNILDFDKILNDLIVPMII